MHTQQELLSKVESFKGNPDAHITNSLRNIATTLVCDVAKISTGQKVLIWFDEPGLPLVQEISNRCQSVAAQPTYFMRDVDTDAQEIAEKLMNEADVVLIVRSPENPEAMSNVPEEVNSVNQAVRRIVIYWPTEKT